MSLSVITYMLLGGWLHIRIKVAIIHDEEGNLLSYDEIQSSGIFHQKVGILKDKEENIGVHPC